MWTKEEKQESEQFAVASRSVEPFSLHTPFCRPYKDCFAVLWLAYENRQTAAKTLVSSNSGKDDKVISVPVT